MRSVFGYLSQVGFGLRFRLLLLVLLTCAPLVALTIHRASDERRRQSAGWRQRSERMMDLTRREEEKLVGQTHQLLLAVAESSQALSQNRRDCKRLVDELFASYPRYANLGMVKADGELVASAVPVPSLNTFDDQAFFQRVMQTRAFAIGPFPVGATNGKPAILLGYPVFNRDGDVQGVVFATLDLAWFNHFGSELPGQLPQGATWTEVDRNGTILARQPAPERWIGKRFRESDLVKRVFAEREGILEDQDGHFYAFATRSSQMANGEVAAILGISKRQLFAGADRMLLWNLTWMGLAAGLAVILGWAGSYLLIVRPIRALVRSTTRLAAGDLSARTGLRHGRDELGQLTLAFDQMAESLENRETERRQAREKVEVLSHQLVHVQESERRQIARELHDEIGQTLTVAEMNLQAALQSPEATALEQRLEDSIQAVERVLEQVHDISLNLRPSMLDDLGLEATLRWYAQRQADLAGLQVEFRADPLERRLAPIIETECFRIAQEALTNVARHSKARAVKVRLSQRDHELHLSVRDDGVGFAVHEVRHRAVQGASLGLLSMEERAVLAGGGLEYRSTPGGGAEVHAWFPLRWRAAAPDALDEDYES